MKKRIISTLLLLCMALTLLPVSVSATTGDKLPGELNFDGYNYEDGTKVVVDKTLTATVSSGLSGATYEFTWYRNEPSTGSTVTPTEVGTGATYTVKKEDIGHFLSCKATVSGYTDYLYCLTSIVEKKDGNKIGPEVLGKSPASSATASDGKITNVTTGMEYRSIAADDETGWQAVTGTEITDLASDVYYVRYKGTDEAKAGEYRRVYVGPKYDGKKVESADSTSELAWTYYPASSQSATFKNTGSDKIDSLNVTVTGDAFAFTVDTTTSITDFGVGSTQTVSVTPKAGLPVGDYNAKLHVDGTAQWDYNLELRLLLNPSTSTITEFGYAYDVQREPAYPVSGKPVTLYSPDNPKDADGTALSSPSGSWTLTELGAYSTITSPSTSLTSIVSGLATKNGINPGTIVVHELKNGTEHIAYGVRVYSSKSGYALFIGDNLSSGGGAGYLLSLSEFSGTKYIRADGIATDTSGSSTPTYYPVTFVTGEGGSTVTSQSIASGQKATAPDDPTRTGYTFGGWFKEATCTNEFNFTSDTITEATTLYAKWTINQYTITFDTAGGSTVDAITQNYGTAIAAPADPTRDGYTFTGWNPEIPATMPVDGMTITAQWTADTPTPTPTPVYTPSYYTITLGSAAHGSISAKPTAAVAGQTVTITVTPDPGYRVDGVTVRDQNGRELTVTRVDETTFTFVMPAGRVTVEPHFSWICPFTDVPADAYYMDALEWAVNGGVTTGRTATTFDPSGICTRAQAVTFLWRAAGSPAPTTAENPFTDVSEDSVYYPAILWAAENGITVGRTATTFDPDGFCTRSHIITFLYRAAKLAGMDVSVGEDTNILSFTDALEIGEFAFAAMQWGCGEDVIHGYDDGSLRPNADCTRAHIISFLYRFYVD